MSNLHRKVERKELGDIDALFATLRAGMLEILKPCERPLVIPDGVKPFMILAVGVNGTGKTTTIGKLARRYRDEGRKVMLAAGDTFRAAAIEQLKVWGERNGVPVIAQASGADPAAVVYDAYDAARARGIDVLIADTAGRLHTQGALMEELKKVKRVVRKLDESLPHETLLVLDAGTGQNAIAQAEQFNAALELTGLVITKLDGTAKGGVVLAIARRMKLPIRYIGVGEQAEDLGVFDAEQFVTALLAPPGTAA
jgi:fused signal recognition particle receptor